MMDGSVCRTRYFEGLEAGILTSDPVSQKSVRSNRILREGIRYWFLRRLVDSLDLVVFLCQGEGEHELLSPS